MTNICFTQLVNHDRMLQRRLDIATQNESENGKSYSIEDITDTKEVR